MNSFTARYYIVLCGMYAQVTVKISILWMKRNPDINLFPAHAELFLHLHGIMATIINL